MSEKLSYRFTVPGDDFTMAGVASNAVKKTLKQLGIDPEAIRKFAVSLYEGEINLFIHAGGGEIEVTIDENRLEAVLTDEGPGIADINLAMSEGWSTATEQVRGLGFGAGMGLPNMKKYSDELVVESTVGVGTTVRLAVNLRPET